MVSASLRHQFLTIIGKTYEKYGYPEYCGWIEGLLLLEQKEWSQRSISKRLGELFPASKYPTSVPSVNRALKLLETYGVVEKAGSRRTGYRYRLLTSSNLISSMLQQLLLINQDFKSKMELLASKKNIDSELDRAISYQIQMAETWNNATEMLLSSISKKEDRKHE